MRYVMMSQLADLGCTAPRGLWFVRGSFLDSLKDGRARDRSHRTGDSLRRSVGRSVRRGCDAERPRAAQIADRDLEEEEEEEGRAAGQPGDAETTAVCQGRETGQTGQGTLRLMN